MKRIVIYSLSTVGAVLLFSALYSTSRDNYDVNSSVSIVDSSQDAANRRPGSINNAQPTSTGDDRRVAGINFAIADRMEAQRLRKTALSIRNLQSQEYLLRRMYRDFYKNSNNPVGRDYPENIRNKLSALLETDVVQLLMSLDIQPDKIDRFRKNGFNLIEAAEAHARGVATPLQEILLSDNTVVAQATTSTNLMEGDGFRSSVNLNVSEKVYGSSSASSLRQSSGIREDGNYVKVSTDLTAGTAQPYLLTLSNSYYQQLAIENSIAKTGSAQSYKPSNNTVLLGVPFIIEGSALIPAAPSLSGNGDLLIIKLEIAKLK